MHLNYEIFYSLTFQMVPVGSGIKDAPRRSSPASHSQAGPAASLDNPEGQFTPEPAQSPGHSACKGTKSAEGNQDGSLKRCEPGQALQTSWGFGEKRKGRFFNSMSVQEGELKK